MICTLSADFFYRLLREERVSPDNFFSGLLTILNRQGLHPLYHSCGYSGCRVIYLLLQFRCFHHLVPEHNRESHLLHIQVVDHPELFDHFVITWRRPAGICFSAWGGTASSNNLQHPYLQMDRRRGNNQFLPDWLSSFVRVALGAWQIRRSRRPHHIIQFRCDWLEHFFQIQFDLFLHPTFSG